MTSIRGNQIAKNKKLYLSFKLNPDPRQVREPLIFLVARTEDAKHCRTVNQFIDYVKKSLKILHNVKFCLLSQQSFAHCIYGGNIN